MNKVIEELKVKKSNIGPEKHYIRPELTATDYWNTCLEIIKDNVDGQVFNTWFLPIKAKKWDVEARTLTIQIPSQWYQEWIEENYYALLDKTIKRVLGGDAKLFYEIVVVDTSVTSTSAVVQAPAFKNIRLYR